MLFWCVSLWFITVSVSIEWLPVAWISQIPLHVLLCVYMVQLMADARDFETEPFCCNDIIFFVCVRARQSNEIKDKDSI